MSRIEQEEAKKAGFDDWFERLWWQDRWLIDDTIVPTLCWFIVGACLYAIWKWT